MFGARSRSEPRDHSIANMFIFRLLHILLISIITAINHYFVTISGPHGNCPDNAAASRRGHHLKGSRTIMMNPNTGRSTYIDWHLIARCFSPGSQRIICVPSEFHINLIECIVRGFIMIQSWAVCTFHSSIRPSRFITISRYLSLYLLLHI